MKILIKNAEVNDFEGIVHILNNIHQLHVDHRPDVYKDASQLISLNDFKELLDDPLTKIIVALEPKTLEIVGYCMFKTREITETTITHAVRYLYIDELGVKKEFRHLKIGSQIFAYIKEFALSNDIHDIRLNVWEFNESAIEFYNSLGMTTRNRQLELNF